MNNMEITRTLHSAAPHGSGHPFRQHRKNNAARSLSRTPVPLVTQSFLMASEGTIRRQGVRFNARPGVQGSWLWIDHEAPAEAFPEGCRELSAGPLVDCIKHQENE